MFESSLLSVEDFNLFKFCFYIENHSDYISIALKLFCWIFFLPVEKEPIDAKSAWSKQDELTIYPEPITERSFEEHPGESIEPLTSLDAVTGESRRGDTWMTEMTSSNLPEQVSFDDTEGGHVAVSNDEVVFLEGPHEQVAGPVIGHVVGNSKDLLETQPQVMESHASELVLSVDSNLTAEVESFNQGSNGSAHSLTLVETVSPSEIQNQFSNLEILHPSQSFHVAVVSSDDVEEQADPLKNFTIAQLDVDDSIAQRTILEGHSPELFPSHSVDLLEGVVVDQLSGQESCKIVEVESDVLQVEKKIRESQTTELVHSDMVDVLEEMKEVDDRMINPVSESVDSLLLAQKEMQASHISELLSSHEFPDLEGMNEENIDSCHIAEVNNDLINAHQHTQESFVSELVPSHAIGNLVDVKEPTIDTFQIGEVQRDLTEANKDTLGSFMEEGVVNCQISEVSDDLSNVERQRQENFALEQLLPRETAALADFEEESGDSCQVYEVIDDLFKGITEMEEHFTSELMPSQEHSNLKDNEEENISSCNIGEVDVDVTKAHQHTEESFVSELLPSHAVDHLNEDEVLPADSQEFCPICDVDDDLLKAEETMRGSEVFGAGCGIEGASTEELLWGKVEESKGVRIRERDDADEISFDDGDFEFVEALETIHSDVEGEIDLAEIYVYAEGFTMLSTSAESCEKNVVVNVAEQGEVNAPTSIQRDGVNDSYLSEFIGGESSTVDQSVMAIGDVCVNDKLSSSVMENSSVEQQLENREMEESVNHDDLVTVNPDDMSEMEESAKRDNPVILNPDDVSDSAHKSFEREESVKHDGHLSVNLDAGRNELKTVCNVEVNRSPSYQESCDVQAPDHGSDPMLSTESKGIYMHAAEMMAVHACNIGNHRCVTKYGFGSSCSDALLPALTHKICSSILTVS